jgi:uncharacterized sulfatase
MQGRAFLGRHEAEPNRYLFGFRGRMDERYDLVRSVTDGRYVYVYNFMPHVPAGQHNAYMFETPTTRVWKKLFDENKLTPEQAQYWQTPRAAEELYDLVEDPDEVKNVAKLPRHTGRRKRLAGELFNHIIDTRDVGLLPEAEVHRRAKGRTPYEMARDKSAYDVRRIQFEAWDAAGRPQEALNVTPKPLQDADSAVRYWAATSAVIAGPQVVQKYAGELRQALRDESPSVRIAAAEALGRHGSDADSREALATLVDLADVKRNGVYVSVAALNALDALDRRALPVKDRIAALPESHPSVIDKMKEYVPQLKKAILADLQ